LIFQSRGKGKESEGTFDKNPCKKSGGESRRIEALMKEVRKRKAY